MEEKATCVDGVKVRGSRLKKVSLLGRSSDFESPGFDKDWHFLH